MGQNLVCKCTDTTRLYDLVNIIQERQRDRDRENTYCHHRIGEKGSFRKPSYDRWEFIALYYNTCVCVCVCVCVEWGI